MSYTFSTDFRGQKIIFELVKYTPNAERIFTKNPNGKSYLHFVESGGGTRHDHYIAKGSLENIHGVLVGFEAPENATVNFIQTPKGLHIYSVTNGNFLRMADQKRGNLTKNKLEKLNLLSLYNIGSLNFVVPSTPVKGFMKPVSKRKNKDLEDILTFKVHSKNQSKLVDVSGGQYRLNDPEKFTLAGLHFRVRYGAIERKLPFQIRLNHFQLEKYPGSESASSYASEITVLDRKKSFDYRIFMNHILDYKGFRFFQSSYDITPTYQETRLSVNHDFWGTKITYVGYFFLFLGLILSMLTKNTRFAYLRKQLKKIRSQKINVTVIVFLSGILGLKAQVQIPTHEATPLKKHSHTAQKTNGNITAAPIKRLTEKEIDSLIKKNTISKKHAEKFSRLIIQDAGGRMKPVHTFASELLRKVSKKENFRGLNASQTLLSIMQYPFFWYQVPVIAIDRSAREYLQKKLTLAKKQKYACLLDFVDKHGNYIISPQIEEIQKKNIRSDVEKKLLAIDRRIGLLYQAISGSVFRFFPIPKHVENKWIARSEMDTHNLSGIDSIFVRQVLPVYRQTLFISQRKNDYTKADEILDGIANFQKKHGAAVHPSKKKIDLEITYNKYDVFKRLYYLLMLTSVVMLLFVFVNIFRAKKIWRFLIRACTVFILICFVAHTAGLIARAFISGHAPWSNGYESIIYVAWATLFFGLVFGRKSALTIAATTFIASMILMIAHWNWTDPEIANLPPVLNSYWLMIHVAIIVGSYGPLSLSMMIGLMNLLLYILLTKKNKQKITLHLKELTIINEMSMVVGVTMLTIGNFLGAMWANESWGRYWGWDPKETWALISIMIYAFILHLRLIPKFKSMFLFNVCSVISFSSIMMTYFGVNFYLSGKHSYASGEQIITPNFVFYTVGIITIFIILAYF